MPDFNISSGLPSYPPGLTDKDAALVLPLYRATNSLAQQLSVQSGNVQYSAAEMASIDQFAKFTAQNTRKVFVQATEALTYGNVINLYISGSTLSARKADASVLTKPAHAVLDIPGGLAVGAYGEVIFMEGRTKGITGSTLLAPYYLSTAGTVQLAAPVATGVINQVVGYGLGSAGFYFCAELVSKRPVYAYKFSATVLRVLYADGTYADLAV